jgi:hypothetical protein
MTATFAAVVVWVTGVVCLAGQLHQLRRRPAPGRHRAPGRMTRRAEAALRAGTEDARHRHIQHQQLRAGVPVLAPVPMFLDDVAPLCPPMYPPLVDGYAHRLGAGRYAHLSPGELDTTNDRLLRRIGVKPVVDLAALRVRGAVPTVREVDDEWYVEVAS